MRAPDPGAPPGHAVAVDRPFDPSASSSSSSLSVNGAPAQLSASGGPVGGPAYATLAYPSLAQPGPSYPPPPPQWFPPHHPAAHAPHAPGPHAPHAPHPQAPTGAAGGGGGGGGGAPPFYGHQHHQPYRPYFGYNQYAAPAAYAPYYGYAGPGPASVQNGYYNADAYRGQYYEPRDDAGAPAKFDDAAGAAPPSDAPQPPLPPHPYAPASGAGQYGFHPAAAAAFPPNHPYAYGSGLGYNQYASPAGAGAGYSAYAEFPPPPPPELNGGPAPHLPPGPPPLPPHAAAAPPAPPAAPSAPASKGLNPAAQGFTYIPPGQREAKMNGHSIPAAGAGGGLGLSQMDRADVVAPATLPAVTAHAAAPSQVHGSLPNGALPNGHGPDGVADETGAEVEATPPALAPVHEATPKAALAPLPAPVAVLTFTGAPLPNVSSPPPRPGASVSPAAGAAPTVVLAFARPDAAGAGNAYSARLVSRIPASVKTVPAEGETDEGAGAPRVRLGRAHPRRARAVFRTGRNVPTALTFGEAETLVMPVAARAPPAPPAPTLLAPSPAPPAAPSPTPRVVSSWAARVASSSTARKTSAAGAPRTPDSLSVAPSSTLPSPSRSLAGLPDAPPASEPATPRSAAPSLPPSTPGTNAPVPAPKPFNYAAAAASGTSSPQEEMGRLLTEGVGRGRRDPALSVPRGLINTGNMCFANTVLVYCPPFVELFEELGKRLKADLGRRTPLLEAMIIFLREFQPAPTANGAAPATLVPAAAANGPSAAGSATPGAATPKGKGHDVGPRREAFVPENVYDAMRENKRFDSMREDAEEYLGFFLNTLHEELLLLHSRLAPPTAAAAPPSPARADGDHVVARPVSPPPASTGADGWLEVGRRQRTHAVRAAEARESAVSRVFGGTLRSVLHTPGQKDSVTLEPYQPLQVDIDDASSPAGLPLTLADALKAMSRPETVPVHSAARGGTVDATKQVYVDAFPPVLILHLKRFVYDAQERAVVKRARPVAYGQELVVPQEIVSPARRAQGPVKYKLFGVVYHHGPSASGGHYTVAVARQDGSGWIHYDDEQVSAVAADDVVVSEDEAAAGRAALVGGREKVAYLLFWVRTR